MGWLDRIKGFFKNRGQKRLESGNEENSISIEESKNDNDFFKSIRVTKEDLIDPKNCRGENFVPNLLRYLGANQNLVQNPRVIKEIENMMIESTNINPELKNCITESYEIDKEKMDKLFENLLVNKLNSSYDKLDNFDVNFESMKKLNEIAFLRMFDIKVVGNKIICLDGVVDDVDPNKIFSNLKTRNITKKIICFDEDTKETEITSLNCNNLPQQISNNKTIYNKFNVPISKEKTILNNGSPKSKNQEIIKRNDKYPHIVEVTSEYDFLKQDGIDPVTQEHYMSALNNIEEIGSLECDVYKLEKLQISPDEHYQSNKTEITEKFKEIAGNSEYSNFSKYLKETEVGKDLEFLETGKGR